MPAEAPRLARTGPAPRAGIVHLGLGAFFRAHGAICIAEAMAASGGDWGILGVSLRSPGVRDALAPQGGVYTALERGPGGDRAQVIGSVSGVLVAPEDPEAVLAAMADPAVRIVSLTVTEKGYCHRPATGALDDGHPDILHDLASTCPVSAPGFLVRALARRRAAGVAPFTVLSCDNLPANGRLVRGLVLDLARRIDPGLAAWIAAEGRFPSAMVDRIVPATTAADIARVAALTGRRDAAPVVHEPFRQWVVEDDFVGGARPDLAAAGVELVADVAAHEAMKLRMLNGTHSALAWLGLLAGHETVADCAADPLFARYLDRVWSREIIPTLDAPQGTDLAAYARALLARYRNPAMRHRTAQIAMDGSRKLPQRLLATLSADLAAGRPAPGLLLAVAAFLHCASGRDLAGRPLAIPDPLAAGLAARAAGPDPVAALLAIPEVFPPALAAALLPGLRAAHAALAAKGVHGALAEVLAAPA